VAFEVNLGALGVDLTLNDQQFQRQVGAARGSVSGLGKTFSKLANPTAWALALTGAAAGVAGGLATAADKAAEFGASITDAGAKAGATEAQLLQLESAALKAGRESAFSAKQAADALGNLAMAGLSVSEQTQALPGVLQLAAAGTLEVADAADIATNVLAGFGKGVEELGEVNDVLAKAATSANTSVEQLGQGMSFAAPTASGLGISIQETAAAIGKLSDAGIKSGRAGRSLNAMFRKTAEVAAKLDVNFTNADFATKGLTGVLQELEDAGLNSANAMDLFGGRAGPAVAALLNQGIESVDTLKQSLDEAGGTAQEIADKQLDSLDGQLKLLDSSAETLAITVGNELKPFLKELATTARGTTDGIAENDAAMMAFRMTLVDSARSMADVLDAVAGFLRISSPFIAALDLAKQAAFNLFIRIPRVAVKLLAGISGVIATSLVGSITLLVQAADVASRALGLDMAESIGKAREAMQNLTGDIAEFSADAFVSAGEDVVDAGTDVLDTLEGIDTSAAADEMEKYSAALRKGADESERMAKKNRDAVQAQNDLNEAGRRAAQGTQRASDSMSDFKAAAEAAEASVKDVGDESVKAAGKMEDAFKKAGEAVQAAFAAASSQYAQGGANAVGDFGSIGTATHTKPQDTGPSDYERRQMVKRSERAGELGRQAQASVDIKTDAANSALQSLAGTTETTSMAMAAATGGISEVVRFLSRFWTQSEAFIEIMDRIGGIMDTVFGGFADVISGDLLVILDPILTTLEAFAPLLSMVNLAMQPMILPLRLLAAGFKALEEPIEKFKDWILRAGMDIQIWFANLFRKDKNKARRVGDQIIDPLGKIGDEMIKITTEFEAAEAAVEETTASVATLGDETERAAEAAEQFVYGLEALHRDWIESTIGDMTDLARQQPGRHTVGAGSGSMSFIGGDVRDRETVIDRLGRRLSGNLEENTDAVRENTAEMRNVPEVWNRALRAAQASTGTHGGGGGGLSSSTRSRLDSAAERRRRVVVTGTEFSSGDPNYF
jgi:TP901 family phage tail tape measure protein